jgi:hypothetical protein
MDVTDRLCHTSSIEVNCPAEVALAYLADGLKQGDWTFGSWERRQIGDNLFAGTSLFDRRETFVRIRPDRANLLVYYDVGVDPGDLRTLNVIRVVPGTVTGRDPRGCVVTLMTWRTAQASDAAWLQLCASHETEMFIIKNRLEAGP